MLELGSLLTGAAVGVVCWIIVDIVTRERHFDPRLGRFEQQRREALRAGSGTYQWMEPAIDEFAAAFVARQGIELEKIQQDLIAAGERLPWKPEEFLATRRVEAIFASVVAAVFGWLLSGMGTAAMFLPMGFMAYEYFGKRLLVSRSMRRRIQLKRRFAAAIDLMALMMEVGGSFKSSLEVAARESSGHPLGYELALVQRDIEHGRLRKDCLREMAKRIHDDDVTEIIVSIVEGEDLGTPLASIFRTQADQLRQKRSQWAEKAAQESQVMLVFPAMIIMVACLITVAAPFILSVIDTSGGR